MLHRKIAYFLAVAIAVLLSACGGGGGGGSDGPVTSTETFQLRSAWDNFVLNSNSYSAKLSGRVSGIDISGSGIMKFGTLTPVIFEGRSAFQKVTAFSGSLTGNGTTAPFSTSGSSYYDANFNPLGSDDDYTVVDSYSIPATARVNDTGVASGSTIYSDSSKNIVIGSETVTFVLQPDTASTALLKLITTPKNASNQIVFTSTEVYRLTPNGQLTPVSVEIIDSGSGDTITFSF